MGDCVMRDRTARTALDRHRSLCPNCDVVVRVGQRCIDHAGLDCEGGGWFVRFHEGCFLLMELFAEKVCYGEWCYPFDVEEAAEHAAANGDDPYWRDWLLIYEKTWAWTPEPSDPLPKNPRWLALAKRPSVVPFEKGMLPSTRIDVRLWREWEG